jgi:hypothetical protein
MWTLILSCYAGMLLTIAATIFAESRHLRLGGRVLSQSTALGLGLLFYYWVPTQDMPRVVSCLVVFLALHWLIAFLPYAAPGDGTMGFWDYNRKLFLRALQTALYTLVLYAGIALALLALENLFGFDFVHAYLVTWLWIVGVFNPIFYLAGFPGIYAQTGTINDYPRGLKVFTQYVLLPLVTIYLAILYAYLLKIIFTAHWPSGWVAYLVLCFSVAGILALLLIWPLRDEEGNRWIRSYSRIFYLALMPLIVLLWVAIAKRMGSYGITEERYYVVLLAAWLSGTACYFVFSPKKDIRLIPASLCALALLSLWGPWSARNLSLANQMGRMKALLEKDGLFVGGKIVPATRQLPLADRKELSSLADYITTMHDYRVLQPWFLANLDSAISRDKAPRSRFYWDEGQTLVRLMGFEYTNRYGVADEVSVDKDVPVTRSFRMSDEHPVLRTGDVDVILPDVAVSPMEHNDSGWSGYGTGKEWTGLRIDSSRHLLEIRMKAMGGASAIDLRPLETAIWDSVQHSVFDGVSQSTMTLENDSYRIVVTNGNAVFDDRQARIVSLRGYLMRLAPDRKQNFDRK